MDLVVRLYLVACDSIIVSVLRTGQALGEGLSSIFLQLVSHVDFAGFPLISFIAMIHAVD